MFRRLLLLPALFVAALAVSSRANAQTTDKDPPAVALKRRGELTYLFTVILASG